MPNIAYEQRKHRDPRPLIERALPDPVGEGNRTASRRTVTVNLAESPLSWLYARGFLSDRQLLAGETLRADYSVATLEPRVTMRWDPVPLGHCRRSAPSGLNPSERTLAAKARFDAAIAVVGPDLADIAWRVVCAGEAMAVAERELAWPVRSGRLVLKIALDRLAEFYRLPG